jgi:uncharacterized SAM-binding protein YcdF (DUF218 family)
MFVLKKIISAFVYPVPVALVVLLVGLALLWRRRASRWGRLGVTVGIALLALFATKPLPELAVRSLEQRYEVFLPARHADEPVEWVVVLAGGVDDDARLPPNDQVTEVGLARLMEGLRILRHYPGARLLLSGGGFFSKIPEAEAMRDVALMLGTDSSRIVIETGSWDTDDQAKAIRQVVEEARFVLVTSAVHLPRAMALFRGQGLEPLPAPTQHQASGPFRPHLRWLLPTAGNLTMLTAAWHEYLGWGWVRLRGLTA